MGVAGASCFHTLSDTQRDISPSEWNEERFGMICTKSENFTEWKKAILKLCRISKACTYNTKKKVVEFHHRIEQHELKLTEEGLYAEEHSCSL